LKYAAAIYFRRMWPVLPTQFPEDGLTEAKSAACILAFDVD